MDLLHSPLIDLHLYPHLPNPFRRGSTFVQFQYPSGCPDPSLDCLHNPSLDWIHNPSLDCLHNPSLDCLHNHTVIYGNNYLLIINHCEIVYYQYPDCYHYRSGTVVKYNHRQFHHYLVSLGWIRVPPMLTHEYYYRFTLSSSQSYIIRLHRCNEHYYLKELNSDGSHSWYNHFQLIYYPITTGRIGTRIVVTNKLIVFCDQVGRHRIVISHHHGVISRIEWNYLRERYWVERIDDHTFHDSEGFTHDHSYVKWIASHHSLLYDIM